jgi:uncharacterized protein
MKNVINWFEIPVKNFERAKKFYETILGTTLPIHDGMSSDGFKMAMLPCDKEGVGGAIVEAKDYEPSQKGVFIYLNGGNDLSVPLSKVEKAGGNILMPKTSIGEYGFMARFTDTEGNKIGFHSMK